MEIEMSECPRAKGCGSKLQKMGLESTIQRATVALQWLLWTLLVMVLVRTAWVGDDAYITMRCVSNAVYGYGLTYNPVERVQAYTHPLWALLLLLVHAMFKSAYYEMILMSLGLSLMALLVAARALRSSATWMALPLLAIASKAWVEYASSGLENALSYLLLCLFVVEWWRWQREQGVVTRLALYACLLVLNRMDLILLIGPALAIAAWQSRSWHALGQWALGFAPFFAWEVFATWYYGYPFPNTAYAKLGTHIPNHQLLLMGWRYVVDSLQRDFVTLPLIAGAVLVGMRQRMHRPLAIGMALYVAYVLRVGGDFMSGRFFAVVAMMALLILGRAFADAKWSMGTLTVFMTALGLLSPTPMLLSGKAYAVPKETLIGPSGVADERAYYFQGTGFLLAFERQNFPDFHWIAEGRRLGKGSPDVFVRKAIGMAGYFAGPRQTIVDQLALSDPLLARIPAVYHLKPRPGHYIRRIPQGYLSSVHSDTNFVEDPALHALYDRIRLLTRGPLWSWERLQMIVSENLGLQPAPDLYHYRFPADHEMTRSLGESNLVSVQDRRTVSMAIPQGAQTLQLQVVTPDGCQLVWMQGSDPIGGILLAASDVVQTFPVPRQATRLLLMREGAHRRCDIMHMKFQ